MKTIHFDVLPKVQLSLFETLAPQAFIGDFYLAGGTCLAMHIGHRRSIDFDFFTPADFNTFTIVNILTQLGSYQRENEEKNTINGSLNGVRISFFGYKYAMIDDFSSFQNIKLAGMRDIAAMKLEAIAGRGSKKDFIDLYFLMHQYSLEEIFSFHALKYGAGLNNQYHLLKSLLYFTDAEADVMPVMVQTVQWNDVKKYITGIVRKFGLK